ncbi:uncharacterized protein SPPG_01218 [Spizellomyces punctatus DAOM BR117]|uniref:THIF-type NAD/FAD binding fold domain-containing protein n=1 Tax=Spizellomyces punctatus (strain DAOM BR117) TaxID=645134 RepID=A0A0L0HRQ9_SPIPD|nr:uncharacterized protein SPPG_01218 [Spizellomyces punctatus DAOM BR117]KND03762.1 hypothetical protein SPPG_01218 [Spizellomyces punctatus DAOM BR117]|eukprot:XP_016611801.1 hypothetical protein SPPG_01218 [Spizellomyces punctatus DAOM BR117]
MGLKAASLGDSIVNTLAVAIAASALTASSIFIVQHFNKRARIKRIKRDISNSIQNSINHLDEATDIARGVTSKKPLTTDEGLIREQLARNYAFLGEEGVAKIRSSFVIVVGLGGVGSHAAHMLLRSGVEHLRLIDFDQVTLSSLNRHAVATQADVGTPKSTCLKKHFLDIAPHAKIDACMELFNIAAAPELLSGNPDYVLDCIDNLNTKMDLIKYCVDSKIRIISSMGAGAKADPSRIQIADISETFEDPLARATRRGLKLKGVESGVTVVYSTEKPGAVKLLPLEEEKVQEADEYSALPDFRVRILPVLGTLPALFGNCMASYVITELAGWPTNPLAIKLREKTYMRLHRDLVNKEKDGFGASANIPFNVSDVGYIFEEIWRGRSALSGTFDKLQLIRWDVTKPASFQNVVCLTRHEAEKHEKILPHELEKHYSPEFIEFVQSRFAEERKINKWR